MAKTKAKKPVDPITLQVIGGALDTIERLGVENLHALRVDSRAAEPVANRFCRSEKYGLIELRAQRVVQRVMHATLGAFRKDQPTPG